MGRPPIAKKRLTKAEYRARWRQKKRQAELQAKLQAAMKSSPGADDETNWQATASMGRRRLELHRSCRLVVRLSHPQNGYDKKTQAHDIAQVMDKLKIEKAALVTHDIGNMVGYALALQL
jgi:pimeloyl-ACP methyl ester carboxylesterase